jgi:hypothetical protein
MDSRESREVWWFDLGSRKFNIKKLTKELREMTLTMQNYLSVLKDYVKA